MLYWSFFKIISLYPACYKLSESNKTSFFLSLSWSPIDPFLQPHASSGYFTRLEGADFLLLRTNSFTYIKMLTKSNHFWEKMTKERKDNTKYQ